MTITILANDNNGVPARDGARSKLHNIIRGFNELGYQINLIDVARRNGKRFSIIRKFIRALKKDDIVVIMLAVNGSRLFLRLSSFIRRKAKLILCPIGMGPIRKIIDKKLSEERACEFINCTSFFGLRDKTIERCLRKTDSVIVENGALKRLYENFYNIKNVHILTNFRFMQNNLAHSTFNSDRLNVVFFSRVAKTKGILDLMSCVQELNAAGEAIFLDIYGDIYLDPDDKGLFDSLLSNNIRYLGTAENDKAIETIAKYDLHCLPTHLEGTPGSLIEAIFAATPTLCTSLPQISEIIDDGVDGFLVDLNSRDALEQKLDNIYKNLNTLPKMSAILIEKRIKFSFDGQRSNFERLFLHIAN